MRTVIVLTLLLVVGSSFLVGCSTQGSSCSICGTRQVEEYPYEVDAQPRDREHDCSRWWCWGWDDYMGYPYKNGCGNFWLN